ncbi:MAG: SPOR domain-containing protein [Bacteroides sp.]
MDRLIEHIGYLLLENDFVLVPELGGFVVNEDCAVCDNSQQTIFSPHSWVSFNNVLTHNDGLLTQLYAKTQSMSYTEAENAVREDVKNLKSEIRSNKDVEIQNWGHLYNKEGVICFRGLTDKMARPRLLGLENISIRTLEDLRMEAETLQEKKNRFSIRRTLTVAAVGVAAAALLFTISIPISDNEESKTQFAGFFSEKHIETGINKKDGCAKEKDLSTMMTSNKMTDVSNTPKEASTADTDNYFLIVGTFRSLSVASRELANFENKGFEKGGIIESSKAKRVYLASFADKEAAINYLSAFVNKNEANKDAWIYRIKDSDKILT